MRRWLYIATFSLILLALPIWAQHRGGGGGGHFSGGGARVASHGGFSGHSSVGHVSGAFRGGGFDRDSGVRFRTGNRYHHHYGFYGRRGYYPYYPYASYYPYGDYGWYDDPLYDSGDQDSYAEGYPADPYREND